MQPPSPSNPYRGRTLAGSQPRLTLAPDNTTPAKSKSGAERLAFGLPDQEACVAHPVTAIVIGAGSRGSVYAAYSAQYKKALHIVGVADPNDIRRTQMTDAYGIQEEHCFRDWSEVFRVSKFADAVIISTPDNMHYEPCMRALAMGYDVLLEKPIAQTERECRNILAQAKKYGRIVGVCHVLRYAPSSVHSSAYSTKGVWAASSACSTSSLYVSTTLHTPMCVATGTPPKPLRRSSLPKRVTTSILSAGY